MLGLRLADGFMRAAQRLDLMRLAQADLRPDPHCLDDAPEGAMQLSHRERVVQFVNEVHPVLPRRPGHASHPTLSLPARGRCARTSRLSHGRPASP